MRIPRAQVEVMLEHARSGYPYEVCGMLLGRGPDGARRVEEVAAVANRETEAPRLRYQIAPEDQIRIQRDARERGWEVIGYYHSHPDHPARPSETDRRIAAEGLSDGVIYVVVGVEGGQKTTASAWVFRDASQAFDEEPFDVV